MIEIKPIPVSSDWKLYKHDKFWTLVHNNCDGYVGFSIDNVEVSRVRCSGCDKRVDEEILKKVPFLLRSKDVVKAWGS